VRTARELEAEYGDQLGRCEECGRLRHEDELLVKVSRNAVVCDECNRTGK
jgi:hypothetical protein